MIASVCSEKLKYNSYLFTIIIISSSNMEGDVSVWHLHQLPPAQDLQDLMRICI